MSRTYPPITDVSCECYQPQQTDDDRRCGRLWRKLKKGLIAGNHVVTKNDSPNDKSYSLTDWHLKSACWRGPDKSENAKDEIQRPISGGAQHAWCNRGKFFSRIAKILFNGQGRRGKAFEVEQEKEETADHLPQDHRQQDLLHHQPADEGNRAWVFRKDVFFELSPQVDNPLNRLVVMAKYGSMMLAGDCDFIQVQQSLEKRSR